MDLETIRSPDLDLKMDPRAHFDRAEWADLANLARDRARTLDTAR
jgi:hypothetical protein